ncbi:MAG: sodium/glutamate symporter [Desulfobacterales bacterium]|jgi:ESS family glutamate:Na+ symporter
MQSPFPFESMLVFGCLAIMLLTGVLLRAKITFFQRFLIPSCLIGGILGIILLNIGVMHVPVANLETFAYHFFNISFISVGLTRNEASPATTKSKIQIFKAPLWMALTQSVIFPLQAIAGGAFVALFGFFGIKLFPTFGFLAPLGFEEGPGQALSIGKVWQGFGFEHATTIGLTFAAMGFFFSFFVGVPLVNWGIRKGLAVHGPRALPQDFLTGIISKNQKRKSAGELPFHSSNLDSLAFHTALVGLVYVLTYGLVKYLGLIVPADVASILWGFFFIFGLSIALGIRWMMARLEIGHLIDPGIQCRITGWSVDFLIVSTVMAIKLTIVWQYILPISGISLVSGALTTFMVVYLGKRIWSYNFERTIAIYGAVTGTVSSGLLLLRIADPDFKTPVAIEIALMNVFSIPSIGLYLVLVNGPVWWNWSIGTTLLVFFGLMILALGLIRVLNFWGSPKF